MKGYRVKIELVEDNSFNDFLRETAWNKEKQKEKLVDIMGYLGNKSATIEEVIRLSKKNKIPLDKFLIVKEGRWWEIYLERDAYDEFLRRERNEES